MEGRRATLPQAPAAEVMLLLGSLPVNVSSKKGAKLMKKEVGLWIDHREAVLVTLTDKEEEMTRIYSDKERNAGFSESAWSPGLQEAANMEDRKTTHGLNRYYDTICLLYTSPSPRDRS